MTDLAIWLIACLLIASPASSVEPWSDDRLPIQEGLILWFDAARQSAGRGANQLPPLTSGNSVDFLLDSSGYGYHLAQRIAEARPRFLQSFAASFVRFDGKDDYLSGSNIRRSLTNGTFFLVAAPRSNPGGFRGLFAMSQAGRNDYTSGLNLDLGFQPTTRLSVLNAEGAGFSGMKNLLPELVLNFATWHLFTLVTSPGTKGTQVFVNGQAHDARQRAPGKLRLDEITVGARYYSNSGEPPHTQGFLDFDFAELIVFQRVLPHSERMAVEKYLENKYAVLRALPPALGPEGSVPLTTVTNAPPVQMFAPGFTVQQLPVVLSNINNLKYRPDGKLVASGYNGHIYLLSDTDGDGTEDKTDAFWAQDGLRAPIGMALTPPGYARGQGVFVAAKGKVALIVDTNRDDRADQEITLAAWTEPSEQHGVDGLGVAVDSAGQVYFSIGAASFTGAYLIDKATGQSRYSLSSERGTILKVSPDFQRREIVCTGVRFGVALAFNRHGDLFCTDQEGATWLPNGNPLDELLHIQPGRHYGFPPRHPKHLPDVIDEPSVFDYTPQHQSTCGLNFNDPVNGGPAFGPAHWSGDAIVAGYSRGKLYRTKLLKTGAGYVAQNQLIAGLNALTVDACVSPRGDLIVATHSGKPDWGSGPNGAGRLYRIQYKEKDFPQPVLVWRASPSELRVAFDRPLAPLQLKNLAANTRITQGKYVFAGDRFETIWPGYQVVHDQMATPRFPVPVLSANLSSDQRTIVLTTPPGVSAVNCAVTLPSSMVGRTLGSSGDLPFHPQIDLAVNANGLEARWQSRDQSGGWEGWWPHPNTEVARAFTRGSAEHDKLWERLSKHGTLTLRGQLDLSQMLQPAIQPGSKLDYERGAEQVSVVFTAARPFTLTYGIKPPLSLAEKTGPAGETARLQAKNTNLNRYSATVAQPGMPGRWLSFSLVLETGEREPDLEMVWFTADDSRLRSFPLARFWLPWAASESTAGSPAGERQIPELTGGNWLRGKSIFFGDEVACYKCHQIRGQGPKVGPDLSNLVHRDYASVLKDIREPNAAINPDHLAYTVELRDRDSVTGMLQEDTASQVTLVDASGKILTFLKGEVKSITPSTLSVMPEGLDKALAPQALADLMTFLLTTPLEPAPLEIKDDPPARTRAELAPVWPGSTLVGETRAPKSLGEFRIVLCAGPKDHGPGEHDYPLWQKRWSKLLALSEKVQVETAQVWPSASQLSHAQVVVFYSANPGWNDQRAKELDSFFERGGGAVFIHYAVDGHKHVDELAARIGLAWRGGASKFRHGPLELKFHDHPLAGGFEQARFVDESYWNLIGNPKAVDLLATGIEEGEPRPLIWTRQQGNGRVFVSIPGHYNWTFDDPLFRLLILRGICWAGAQPRDRLSELATIGARLTD